MGLLTLINKIAGVVADEITTPQAAKDGQAFEDYVRKYLFVKQYYDLLEMTHDYHTNHKDYVESSLKPDFMFRDKYTEREFYIEVKYRANLYNGKLVWCNDEQLNRYQYINKYVPVYLILGDGGKPHWPDSLSQIPLSKAKYTGLFPWFADKFAIEPERPVTSYALWNR